MEPLSGPAVCCKPSGEASVVVLISGNCCLKLANKSSAGFCALVLYQGRMVSLSAFWEENFRVGTNQNRQYY